MAKLKGLFNSSTAAGATLKQQQIMIGKVRLRPCVQSEAYVGCRIFMCKRYQNYVKKCCALRWCKSHMQNTGGYELLAQQRLVNIRG